MLCKHNSCDCKTPSLKTKAMNSLLMRITAHRLNWEKWRKNRQQEVATPFFLPWYDFHLLFMLNTLVQYQELEMKLFSLILFTNKETISYVQMTRQWALWWLKEKYTLLRRKKDEKRIFSHFCSTSSGNMHAPAVEASPKWRWSFILRFLS